MTESSFHQGGTKKNQPVSARGTRVVWALLLVGVAAGVVSVTYWSALGRFMRSPSAQPESQQDAGSAPWDKHAADAELDELKQAFEQIVSNNQKADSFVDSVRRSVERYPKYASARTLLGQVFLYQGQVESAYEQLALSLELNGQQPEVHLLAGTILYGLNRIEQATGHYSKAVGLEPSETRYRLHLAQAYVSVQKHQQARDVLLEALRIDSSLHAAYAVLADIYARQNKLTLALTAIQHALQHTPASQQANQAAYTRRKAALLRRDNRPQEALLTLQSLSSQQVDAAILEEMATCWSMMGKPAEAALLFEQAMTVNPTAPALVAGAVRWRVKAGDKDAARKHLDRLRRINPRSDIVAQLEAQFDSAADGGGDR